MVAVRPTLFLLCGKIASGKSTLAATLAEQPNTLLLKEDQLLAELLPPLEPDGTSHLWEALGRRFTGLTYAEADRLSSRDKEFIRDLFPLGEIHTSLFDDRARDVIGQVGKQTLGVERMLRAAGFQYAWRVDPFDGGPHFVAATDEVTLIQKARRARFAGALPAERTSSAPRPSCGVVLQYLTSVPYVRSVQSEFEWAEPDGVLLPESVKEHLGLEQGAELMVTPLPSSEPFTAASSR